MRNFLFYDNDSGEHFIVEAESYLQARIIANDEFDDAEFVEEISYEEAEMLGYDTF